MQCPFISSSLSEQFTVNLDFNGEFLSLSTHTDDNFCTTLEKSLNTDQFNTSVFVVQTTIAPVYVLNAMYFQQQKNKLIIYSSIYNI